jgi:Tfp pilus assembly protein PilF
MVRLHRLLALVLVLGLHLPAELVATTPAPPQTAEPEITSPEHAAAVLWQRGYLLHVFGHYQAAIEHFRRSIAVHPTAEAHTFLGWSLSHLGQLEEAITQCEIAIKVDPGFGNPYNDIGVYLIDLGRADEAIPWFDKAIESARYCCYQFPYFNKGRVLLRKGSIEEAKRLFERALKHDPDYVPAREGLRYIAEKLGRPL